MLAIVFRLHSYSYFLLLGQNGAMKRKQNSECERGCFMPFRKWRMTRSLGSPSPFPWELVLIWLMGALLWGGGVGYSYGDVRRAVHWVLCVNQAGMLQSISKNPQKCTIGWALVKIIFLKLAINQTKIAIIFGLLFWTKLVKFCVFLTHVTKTLPSLDKKFRKVNSYLLPPITLNI